MTRKGGSLWRRILIGVVAAILIAYVAVNIAIRSRWVSDWVHRELDRVVQIATDGDYGLDFGSLSFNWNFQHFTVRSVELLPRGEDASIEVASLEALEIRDIHWISTLRGKPSVDAIEVNAPRLALSLGFITEGADSVPRSATRPNLAGVPGEVGDVRLLGGSVRVTSYTDHGKQVTILNGVDLEIKSLGSGWKEPVGFILANADVNLKVGSAHLALDDSLHAIDIEAFDASSRESVARFGSVGINPLVSDSVFVGRLEHRMDRIKVSTSGVEFRGVDFGAALSDGAIRASLVTVDSFGVDIFSDHRVPARVATEQRAFLTERLRDLPNPVAIDSLVVLDGSIRYTEHASDGVYPGTIAFEQVTGSLINLSNDPEHTDVSQPLVVRARGLLQGAAAVTAELAIPVLEPTFEMYFTASAGSVDAIVLNDITIPLEGIEFASGHADTVWLDGFVSNGMSDGVVNMDYRDLSLRAVDKRTGEQDLGRRVATVIANLLFVDPQNTPEERDYRVGQISYTRRLGDTVWGFLWYSVRSALLPLVVRGGELPR